MNKKEKLLNDLGLKDTAAQMYLYLLKAKKATILEVAKETGIARTNVYNNVARLIQMGLVGEAIEKGKKILVPESPTNLINFVKAKESIAKEAAGLLQEDFLTNKYESKIRFASGPEGFKKFADELINHCKEKLVRQIVSHKSLTEYSNKKFLKSHWNKRRNKNIYAKS